MQSYGLQETYTHPTVTRKEGTGNKYPGTSHSVHSWWARSPKQQEVGKWLISAVTLYRGRKGHRESRIQRGPRNRARAERRGEERRSDGVRGDRARAERTGKVMGSEGSPRLQTV